MSQIGPQDPNQPQYQHPVYPGQQPPQGYQPPMQGWPPKPKKTHKFRNFVVFPLVGLVALMVVITAASGGGSSNTPAADASKTAPQNRNDPREVTPGVAFTIGKHRLDAGWAISNDQYLGSKLLGHVTNVSNSTSTAFFSVKFLKGDVVLANFNCSTEALEPHQVQQIECYNAVTSTTRVTGWTKVTAEATL